MQYDAGDRSTRPLPAGGRRRAPEPDEDDYDYGYDGYGDHDGYGPVEPRWWQRRGMVLALTAATLVASGGFYAAYSFTKTAIDTPSAAAPRPQLPQSLPSQDSAEVPVTPEEPPPAPTEEPSPSSPPVASEPFTDDELREFAGRLARNDDECQVDRNGSFQNVTEAVSCNFGREITVRYLKFENAEARDDYKAGVRAGLGGELDIRRDAVWSERGRQVGTFVSGSQNGGGVQYVYWDEFDAAVSGEMLVASRDDGEAERIWEREL